MIDSLTSILPLAKSSKILKNLGLNKGKFILVTMHRPSNVDSEQRLKGLVKMLNSLSLHRKIVFPIHPRTRKNLGKFRLLKKLNENILLTDPIGYIDFISLLKKSELILTDSGGIQEESTYLGTQCITLRTTTERPSTVREGTNQLIGEDFAKAEKAVIKVIKGKKKTGSIPDLWDGKTAKRICKILAAKAK